jgi:hypothetical protein
MRRNRAAQEQDAFVWVDSVRPCTGSGKTGRIWPALFNVSNICAQKWARATDYVFV